MFVKDIKLDKQKLVCYIIIMRKILIPNKPHLDPIAAIYLLQEYGEEKFPGIKEAEFYFWEDKMQTPRRYYEYRKAENESHSADPGARSILSTLVWGHKQIPGIRDY